MAEPEPEEIMRIKRKKVLTDRDIAILNEYNWRRVFGKPIPSE